MNKIRELFSFKTTLDLHKLKVDKQKRLHEEWNEIVERVEKENREFTDLEKLHLRIIRLEIDNI